MLINNPIKQKDSLNKLGLALAAGFIVALLTYSFTTLKDIKSISNDIYQARVELEKKYLSGITLRKNSLQLTELKPRLQDLESSILKYENNLEFISDLENEADKLGLKLSINIPEIEIKEGITPSPIQLTVIGKQDRALEYLNILDKKNYYLNFSSIRLTNTASLQSDNDNFVTLTFDGKIYWE